MQGFFRLVDYHLSGSGLITLGADELLGLAIMSPCTAGVGHCHIYENNAQGALIAHFYTNAFVGQKIVGPFQHSSKKLWYIVLGTGAYLDVYAWKNAEVHRSQF